MLCNSLSFKYQVALNPCQFRSMDIATYSATDSSALFASLRKPFITVSVIGAFFAFRCVMKSFASCPLIQNCSSSISDSLFCVVFLGSLTGSKE